MGISLSTEMATTVKPLARWGGSKLIPKAALYRKMAKPK